MLKQVMARPVRRRGQPGSEARPSPELREKVRTGIAAAHSTPRAAHDPDQHVSQAERLISKAYSTVDNDLARDNLENDLPGADLQDL